MSLIRIMPALRRTGVPWINSEPASPQWVAPASQGGVLVTASVILRFDLVPDRGEGES